MEENITLKKHIAFLCKENEKFKKMHNEVENTMQAIDQVFTSGQKRKLLNPNKRIHWNWEDISYGISLHSTGPRAYRKLYNDNFPLPSVNTLNRWARKLQFREGLQTNLIKLMKEEDLSPIEKICVICFDEMKVKFTYEYDPSNDCIRPPANYVQVLSVRGLIKSWKQEIFFDFDTKMEKTLLFKIITTLKHAGFEVVAIVSDMGPTNQSLLKELNINTSKIFLVLHFY